MKYVEWIDLLILMIGGWGFYHMGGTQSLLFMMPWIVLCVVSVALQAFQKRINFCGEFIMAIAACKEIVNIILWMAGGIGIMLFGFNQFDSYLMLSLVVGIGVIMMLLSILGVISGSETIRLVMQLNDDKHEIQKMKNEFDKKT